MPSLKDVKMKIVGVVKTKQITKAMNMVASAKLRGAQSTMSVSALHEVSGCARRSCGQIRHRLMRFSSAVPKCHVSVIILATSDRGLCGGSTPCSSPRLLTPPGRTAEGNSQVHLRG